MFYIRDKAAALESKGKKIYHMELGDPNFNSPVEAAKTAISVIEANQTHYTSSWGLDSFRETITKKHINELGYECKKSNVISLPGANSGIYFIIRVTTKPGDTVLIPDPGFPIPDCQSIPRKQAWFPAGSPGRIHPDPGDEQNWSQSRNVATCVSVN